MKVMIYEKVKGLDWTTINLGLFLLMAISKACPDSDL